MCSYQMYRMLAEIGTPARKTKSILVGNEDKHEPTREGGYGELKVGQLARTVLLPLIVAKATDEELCWMQNAEYSKNNFGLNYPMLIKTNSPKKDPRYYNELIEIRGITYRFCSEWFEIEVNNDRPYIEKWIEKYNNR